MSGDRRRLALVIEYDGSRFCGYQEQRPGLRSVQTALRGALETYLREPVTDLTASGRTDSGVHARGQVVSFTTRAGLDYGLLMHGVSNILRGDVGIRAVREVPFAFDPRHHAIRKMYRYLVLNRCAPAVLDRGSSWHVTSPLDLDFLIEESSVLVGRHDFASFRAGGCQAKTTTRRLEGLAIAREDDTIRFELTGNGFLKYMVRNIVGTLVDRARGKIPDRTTAEILAARDRRAAGMTAPAYGLTLEWVEYPEEFGLGTADARCW